MSLSKFLFALFLCFILCGCSQKDDRTVVQFASWGSKTEIDILKPVLLEFEKENPDIKVDFMHIPQNYFQKVHLLFASNTAPDVIFINNHYLPVYANAGLLEPLQVSEGYYPKAVEAMKWKGVLYAVPRDVSNLVIFYNKDLFDKNNVKYPSENWDFSGFLESAKKLTGNGVFGVSFDEEPLFYLPYLMSEGGDFLDLSSPQSQKGINFYADLRKKYHVAPLKSESASATMAQMFLQGKVGMYVSGRWMVPKIREDAEFRWDVARFPQGAAGSVVPLDASGWAVSKNSRHKSEAKRLVNYLSSQECSEKFAQSGLIIPARIEASEKIAQEKVPEHSRIFLDVIQTSKPTPVTVDYRQILDKVKKDLEPKFN